MKLFWAFFLGGILAACAWPAYAQRTPKTGQQLFRAVSDQPFKTKPSGLPTGPKLHRTARVPAQTLSLYIQKKSISTRYPWQGRIFQAAAPNKPQLSFSGTVFQTEYNGQPEIYGVIATHAVSPHEDGLSGISRHFTATFFRPDGTTVKLPAEIVAFSPTSMLDLALVKFSKEAESFLKPYRLGQLGEEQTFHSLGYTDYGLLEIPNRRLLAKLPYSIQTSMPIWDKTKRRGFCGSPLLNRKNELVGIHTGTLFDLYDQTNAPLRSYATPAHYLNLLVEAYHNGGKVNVPFYLDETRFVTFPADEYIVSYQLLDRFGRPLLVQEIITRPSRSQLKNQLQRFAQAKFLLINTHRRVWNKANTALPVYFEYEGQAPKKTYLYNLRSGQQWQLPAWASRFYKGS